MNKKLFISFLFICAFTVLTAVTFANKENLSKVTLVFKLKGKNLQVINVLPSYVGKIGKTFIKVTR
jgi:hypothetical protein